MTSTLRCAILAGLAAFLAVVAAASPAKAIEAPPSHLFMGSVAGFVKELDQDPVPPPDGEFEDACGVAVDSAGDIYVADYYHRRIYVYDAGRTYMTQIADPDPDGPCDLAVDSTGNLYVNHWHRDVVRFAPSSYPPTPLTTYGAATTVDAARSTGVAVDPATDDVYVDDLTYVARYSAPVGPEPQAVATLGSGSLGSGYGVAVSAHPASAGDVYVPDAADDTVKVYDPGAPGSPVQVIDGAGTPQAGFHSLLDSDVAVDASSGHVYVADNLEPRFARPAAVVDEFNSAGDYRGQLPRTFLDAEPTALAVAGGGDVYASNGNTEEATIDIFGPTLPAFSLEVLRSGSGEGSVGSEPAGIRCPGACRAEYNVGSEVKLIPTPAPGSAFAGWSGGGCTGPNACTVTMNEPTTVTAEFTAVPQALLQPDGQGPGPATEIAADLGPMTAVARTSATTKTSATSASGGAPGRRIHRRRHRRPHFRGGPSRAGRSRR
jgi:hypothetical protein